MFDRVQRIAAGFAGIACFAALACAAYAVVDIRSFEWKPLHELLGVRGWLFCIFMVAGLALLTYLLLSRGLLRRRAGQRVSRWALIFLVLWGAAIVWLAEWVFQETPISVRIEDKMLDASSEQRAVDQALRRATADGSIPALLRVAPHADKRALAIMLARIEVNQPSVFDKVSVGATITKYAERYHVSPVLLLHWVYIDSFYGEAPSGPMPFFHEINAEMFRDLVQAHLPWWFIESPVRSALIDGTFFNKVAGDGFGMKLRYALQKADYDISITPYMNSLYSDLFPILREYPEEFPELFVTGKDDPLTKAFLELEPTVLPRPIDSPYLQPRRDSAYYRQHRDALISFGRAAVYRLSRDFDFATKAQALVARYYSDEYARRLGADRWAQVSEQQQTAMLAMLRDVYMPNIGKLSSNVYLVPEFNTTPITFLANQAAGDFEDVKRTDKTWIPKESEKMWGATGLMLQVLGEVWGVMSGTPLPGVRPAQTIEDSLQVVTRDYASDT